MDSIRQQQASWLRHRQRLEQESRVLVIDSDPGVCKQLEDLLYRRRVPARAVATARQALEIVGREHYSVMVVAEQLPGMRGLALTRQVHVSHPDVDVIVTSQAPSVELLRQSFELRLLDVLSKPLDDLEQVGARLTRAVRKHVDRRMRQHVLNELRTSLELLAPDARLRTISALDQRLAAFKSTLGSAGQVLVVEASSELRTLSESLLLAGMSVETTEYLDEALQRAVAGDVLLLLVGSPLDEPQLLRLVAALRELDLHIELALVAGEPTVEQALTALREDVAAYLPWPPSTSMSHIALRMRDILRRGRQARLVDKLFVELYRETASALGDDSPERETTENTENTENAENAENADFAAYRELIGLERRGTPRQARAVADPVSDTKLEAIAELDRALTEILDDLDGRAVAQQRTAGRGQDDAGAQRRAHARVPDSQFVRFRGTGSSAAVLACLGDLSQGGVFIRTAQLPRVGEALEVDISAEYQGQRYLVCCRAAVAWLARDEQASSMAPGFGVRFLDPPDDVRELLAQMVAARQTEHQDQD